MAEHIRTTVRNAIAAALVDKTIARDSVFKHRFDALSERQLPALKVFTPSSAKSLVEVVIEAVVIAPPDEDNQGLADYLDDIAVEIEAALALDPTFGGVVSDFDIRDQEITQDKEGDRTVGVLSIKATADARVERIQIGGVNLGGVNLGGLRGFSIDLACDPGDVSHSGESWRMHKRDVLAEWSATIELRLDDSDPGQAALALRSSVIAVFFANGVAAGQTNSGVAIVSSISDSFAEDGEKLRTVTMIGSGALS